MFKYLLLLVSFNVSANSLHFPPSACGMLGGIASEIVAREIRQEPVLKYLQEIFPRIDKFNKDETEFMGWMLAAIKADRKAYPEYANQPKVHEENFVRFCMEAQGNAKLMIESMKDFVKNSNGVRR